MNGDSEEQVRLVGGPFDGMSVAIDTRFLLAGVTTGEMSAIYARQNDDCGNPVYRFMGRVA